MQNKILAKQRNPIGEYCVKGDFGGHHKRNREFVITLIVLALFGAAVRHLLFPDFFDVWTDGERVHALLVFALFCGLGLACNSMEIKRKAPEIDHRLLCFGKTDLSNKNANQAFFIILGAAFYFEFIVVPKQSISISFYFLAATSSFMLTRNTAIEAEFLWVKIVYVVVPLLLFLFSWHFVASKDFMNVFSSQDYLRGGKLLELLNYKEELLLFLLPIFSIGATIRLIKNKKRRA